MDDGHHLVMAAAFPVIASIPEPIDCFLLPDWKSKDYINLLALIYGGPLR